MEKKIFPISWNPNCTLIRCAVVKTFVDRLKGILNYTNCSEDCEFNLVFDDDTDSSLYFLEFLNIRIIVPRKPKIDRTLYIFYPFKLETWIFVIFFLFLMPTVLEIYKWSGYFIKTFKTFSILGSTHPKRTKGLMALINSLISFNALFICIWYSSFLGSFFVKDTHKIPIICQDVYFNYEYYKSGIIFKPSPFDNYLKIMENMNTSFGYCLSLPYEKFFQKNMENNIFAFRKETLYTSKPVYHFQEKDKTLADDFKKYIIDVYSSGFMTYWGIQFSQKSILKSFRKIEAEEQDLTLNMKEFEIPIAIFGAGLLLALFFFLIECIKCN